MNITLVEPFFTGSHAAWAREYARHSRHRIEILGLSGNHWKWRMHGGAVTLAGQFLQSGAAPDLILATDMLDLTVFLALTRRRSAGVPVALYFHENQIGYPRSPEDRDALHQRDHHYGFINYTAALAADSVLFNSRYHHDSFLEALPGFLRQFPDHRGLETVAAIGEKSRVLPLGVDLRRFDTEEGETPDQRRASRPPLLVWNHRWEYDKNPDDFFRALYALDAAGVDFRVAILGPSAHRRNPLFDAARERLAGKVVHCGYVPDFHPYAQWLHRADILPVTSRQDFFGVSLVQALYCGCYPLLPKRLAYPELVPLEDYPEVFYDDFDALVEKLMAAVREIDRIRQQSFRHCVQRYDWQSMAPVYDTALEAVVAPGGGS